jgi:hypothetical protein
MSEYNNPITTMGNRINERMVNVAIDMLLGLLAALVRPLAVVTEVVFRKQMGERYFHVIHSMAGAVLIFLSGIPFWHTDFALYALSHPAVAFQYYNRWPAGAALTMYVAWGWLAAFYVFCFLHGRAIKARYRAGLRWHSYCYGIPRFAGLPVILERILPLAAAAALIYYGAYSPAVLLVISTYISYMTRVREAAQFQGRVLDAVDMQIEAENLSNAVLQRLTPEQAEGVVAPLPAYVSDKCRELFVGKKKAVVTQRVLGVPQAPVGISASGGRMPR